MPYNDKSLFLQKKTQQLRSSVDGIWFILNFEGEHEKQITEPFMKVIITSGLQEQHRNSDWNL